MRYISFLFLLLGAINALAQTQPEGHDYATQVHHDPWDMSNKEDIYALDWVHNLASIEFKDGILNAKPKDNDPHVWLQFPQIASSIPTLDQRQQTIDANRYNQLSFYLWLPDSIDSSKRGRIVWHSGGDTITEFDAAYSESELFPVQAGWHLYTLDLSTIGLSKGTSWSGLIHGLRIDPCVGGCDEFKLDWVRLVAPNSSANSAYQADANQSAVLLDLDNNVDNGFFTSISQDSNFSLSHLPPNNYFVAPISDNNYALSQRLDLWDMSETSDILFDLLNDWTGAKLENGSFKGTTNGPDPNLMLNIPADRPIDASEYKYLTVNLTISNMPSQEAGLLVYWGNIINTPVSHTDFIPTSSGSQSYQIDLSQYSSWNGDIRTLRIDPVNGPNAANRVSISIDSVQLTKSPGNSSSAISYLNEPLTINSTPVLAINHPSPQSGEDYASQVLGNPWEMDDRADVASEQNLVASSFINTISDLNINGNFFTATSIAKQPEGDPGVWLSFQQTAKPINAEKYHLLSFDLYVPFDANAQQELTDGAVIRVAWKANDFDSGLTTDDILMMPGLHRYVLDMKQVRYEPASSRTWSGLIHYFRIDPLEFPTPRSFYLDSVKLRALPSYGQVLPVDINIEDKNADKLSLDILVDGQLLAQRSGLNVGENRIYVDLASIANGSHQLSLQVSDGTNQSSRAALVNFVKEGANHGFSATSNESYYDTQAQLLHLPNVKVEGAGNYTVQLGVDNLSSLEFSLAEVLAPNVSDGNEINFNFASKLLEIPNLNLVSSAGKLAQYAVTLELISDSPIKFKVIKLQPL